MCSSEGFAICPSQQPYMRLNLAAGRFPGRMAGRQLIHWLGAASKFLQVYMTAMDSEAATGSMQDGCAQQSAPRHASVTPPSSPRRVHAALVPFTTYVTTGS
jgi:hypothetical protein